MPLFFFVSGFVLYKSSFEWNFNNTISFLKKKIPVQLFSPLLFLTISASLRHISLSGALGSESKAGYWFTFMLFSYFLFYIGLQWIIRFGDKLRNYDDIILLVFGIAIYIFVKEYVFDAGITTKVARALMFSKWQYFVYFVLGTRVRKYFSTYEKLLDSRFFTLIIVVLFFFLLLLDERINLNKAFVDFVLAVSGINIVVALFRKHQDLFGTSTRLGRIAQYVGRRTLDIYLLHFFFVNASMTPFFTYFSTHNSPFLEFIISVAISILIIMASLLLSNVLRLNPILAHYLFGQKKID